MGSGGRTERYSEMMEMHSKPRSRRKSKCRCGDKCMLAVLKEELRGWVEHWQDCRRHSGNQGTGQCSSNVLW